MLKRILIANRGEIACRIARTCARLGVEYVAVHSSADAGARHLAGAAASVAIGDAPAASSYLDIGRIVDAARATGCDAVHPGYGFLSENPAFARAVEDAGLIFIGPRPETIAALGDKATAKQLMRAAGVPVVPGSEAASDDPAEVAELARATGFPALLKPSAGGGGKGMTVVRGVDGLVAAAEAAIRLARANFGDGRLLVERFVERPRHIEVQVFGDRHGAVVHAFERECSLQRRHQKVIEEAPAVRLAEATRAALLDAAVRGARALGYLNAGTFEFIVDPDGRFYFMEVNTRLQVEHPVSEATLGIDFVEWQLRIAAGEPLPCDQAALVQRGHAIEARIYAEDAARQFAPSPGRAVQVAWPAGVRVESAIGSGDVVTPYYDPMVAKLIVHGADRPAALALLSAALADSVVLGLTTNLGFLGQVVRDPDVVAGDFDTGFLDARLARFVDLPDDAAAAACAAAFDWAQARGTAVAGPWGGGGRGLDRAALAADAPAGRYRAAPIGGAGDATPRDVGLVAVVAGDAGGAAAGAATLTLVADPAAGPRRVTVVLGSADADRVTTGRLDGRPWHGRADGDVVELQIDGWRRSVRQPSAHRTVADGQAGDAALAPMHGVVVALPVRVGDRVTAGDVLAVVEAMKMENAVLAPRDGEVAAVDVAVGAAVAQGQQLVALASVSA